jgi:hypothetical protein
MKKKVAVVGFSTNFQSQIVRKGKKTKERNAKLYSFKTVTTHNIKDSNGSDTPE